MLSKPRSVFIFLNSFNNSLKHEHSCKLLYLSWSIYAYTLKLLMAKQFHTDFTRTAEHDKCWTMFPFHFGQNKPRTCISHHIFQLVIYKYLHFRSNPLMDL